MAPERVTVLVLGGTGVGKSSIIRELTNQPVKVGDSLRSCTHDCSSWEFQYSPDLHITIIDSPGFNDTARSDMDVLQTISEFITAPNCAPIAAVLFLHRITDTRFGGSPRMTLDVLRALCGEKFLPYVAVVTTMWNTLPEDIDQDKYEAREVELKSTKGGWGELTRKGCQTMPYLGTRKSALKIISKVVGESSRVGLQFLAEIRSGLELENTSAGRVLTEELRRRNEKRRKEDEEEQAYMQEDLRKKKELLHRAEFEAGTRVERDNQLARGQDFTRVSLQSGDRQESEPWIRRSQGQDMPEKGRGALNAIMSYLSL